MKPNIIREKSFEFAVSIVKQYDILILEKQYRLADQLLRSGTSIGANVFESRHSESKKDFIHKLLIALKESDEAEYWLRLLERTNKIETSNFESLYSDLDEIIRILSSIVKTSKNSLK